MSSRASCRTRPMSRCTSRSARVSMVWSSTGACGPPLRSRAITSTSWLLRTAAPRKSALGFKTPARGILTSLGMSTVGQATGASTLAPLPPPPPATPLQLVCSPTPPAAIKAKQMPPIGHYMLHLRDMLVDVCRNTPHADTHERIKGWRRVDTLQDVTVPRGCEEGLLRDSQVFALNKQMGKARSQVCCYARAKIAPCSAHSSFEC